MDNITRNKIRSSTIWATNSKVISQILGFITTLVLVRLLDLDDFGLMAMAMSFIGLIDTFIDLGFLSAIIQVKEIHRRQLSTCFWLLSAISVVVTTLTFALAPLIARFYSEVGVTSLIHWIAPLFLLAPLTIVCKGILSRDLRLDVLSKIELYAAFSKMALSTVLAVLGFGIFSLVMGYILERLILTIWCAISARWYPRFEYDRECMFHFFTFGSKTTASSILWYLYTKADVFVIGRLLGAEVLGVYNIASQFPQTIARIVPSTWHRIAYPLFARYQASPDLKLIVSRSSSLLLLVCLPLFLGLAAIAPDVIQIFFGSRWQEAVFPLQMLSVVAALETVTWTLASALNAIGRPGVNTLINVTAALLFPFMFYIGALYWGIDGVLWTSILAYTYRFLAFLIIICLFLKLRIWHFIKEHLGSVAAGFVMFIGLMLLQRELEDWNNYLRMVTCVGFGTITYLAALFCTSRKQISLLISYLRAV